MLHLLGTPALLAVASDGEGDSGGLRMFFVCNAVVLALILGAVLFAKRRRRRKPSAEFAVIAESGPVHERKAALLELRRRGEDISRFIPHLLSLLVSPSSTKRSLAFDLVKDVFPDVAKRLDGYQYDIVDEAKCREKVGPLLANYGIDVLPPNKLGTICPSCKGKKAKDITSEKYLSALNMEHMPQNSDCFKCPECGHIWAVPWSKAENVGSGCLSLIGSLVCFGLGGLWIWAQVGSGGPPEIQMPGGQTVTGERVTIAFLVGLFLLFGGGLGLLAKALVGFSSARAAKDVAAESEKEKNGKSKTQSQ
jgi:hypothetical protein